MRIAHVNKVADAAKYLRQGFEPVECSFGVDGSVVGMLQMDHHGSFSHLEGVALRAYRDHWGACRLNRKFVVTGAADADACFAIAALCGLLPHPKAAEIAAEHGRTARPEECRDITALAQHVNLLDTDPIGNSTVETEEGRLLTLWNVLGNGMDDLAFYSGVHLWRRLLTSPPQSLIDAAVSEKAYRIRAAQDAYRAFPSINSRVLFVAGCDVWGFDVWYQTAPVVVSYTKRGGVTIGCVSEAKAAELFGAGGLANVWPRLQPYGWGGRSTIGGSPRGEVLTEGEAFAAACMVDALAGPETK